MRLLIDASHQRAGGGLQVALGTLDAIRAVDCAFQIDLLCVEGSALARPDSARGFPVLTVADSAADRVRRQIRGRPRHRTTSYDCIYTIFGPPIRNRGGVVNVVGVAYSQLFYPEIDFWRGAPRYRRPMLRARGRLRLGAIRQADGWIFETEVMRRRATEQLGLAPERTAVIPPAPSPFIAQPEHSGRLAEGLAALPPRPRILLASGWHPNKNLHLVPEVARACRRIFGESPLFVFTLDPASRGAAELDRLAAELGVADDLHYLGRVDQRCIGQALAAVDGILLLSELESFSNNVIEAFVGGLPLVISDRDWARSACRDAALYVEPGNAEQVARGVMEALGPQRTCLVARGAALARTMYSTPEARVSKVLDFLATVHRLGPVRGRGLTWRS